MTAERVRPTPPRSDLESIPPYVPGRHPSEITRAYGIGDVAKLASNESPIGPSPAAVEAVEAAVRAAHVYPDARVVALRGVLAARHGVDREAIVVANGSVECIDLIARAFLRPGDHAVVGFPTFPRYVIACRLVGVDPTVVSQRDWTHDLDAMRAAITTRTRVVFVDDPCNPTGTHVGAGALADFLDAVPDDVLVVLDRAYYEFVPPDDRLEDDLERIRCGANLVVLRTFSKAYGLAGLRVGYAIARPEHAAALWRVREAFAVNALGQAAALAAVDDEAHVRRVVGLVTSERQRVGAAFDRIGIEYVPSVSTNFLFADLGPDATGVHEALLSRGVVVRPMTAPEIATRARISIGPPAWNDRLIDALEEIVR